MERSNLIPPNEEFRVEVKFIIAPGMELIRFFNPEIENGDSEDFPILNNIISILVCF